MICFKRNNCSGTLLKSCDAPWHFSSVYVLQFPALRGYCRHLVASDFERSSGTRQIWTDGGIKLINFGLAMGLTDSGVLARQVSGTALPSRPAGKFNYAAPEVYRNERFDGAQTCVSPAFPLYTHSPPCKIPKVYIWRILQGGLCAYDGNAGAGSAAVVLFAMLTGKFLYERPDASKDQRFKALSTPQPGEFFPRGNVQDVLRMRGLSISPGAADLLSRMLVPDCADARFTLRQIRSHTWVTDLCRAVDAETPSGPRPEHQAAVLIPPISLPPPCSCTHCKWPGDLTRSPGNSARTSSWDRISIRILIDAMSYEPTVSRSTAPPSGSTQASSQLELLLTTTGYARALVCVSWTTLGEIQNTCNMFDDTHTDAAAFSSSDDDYINRAAERRDLCKPKSLLVEL